MEFLGKLGIDIKLLIAQILNFGLLLFLLKKLLYTPIIKRIEKGEKELDEATALKNKLEEDKRRLQEQLVVTRKRARNIIVEAEKIASQIQERVRLQTQEEKEKVIRQIRERLENLKNGKIS